MIDTEILLNNSTSNEEKCSAANNIIVNYELPLNVEQILLAHKKTRDWLNKTYNLEYSRIFLFNKVLEINKNMYIAIILALCDNFNPSNLYYFLKFNDSYVPINIRTTVISYYYTLLNYYEFDASTLPNILEEEYELIQSYRVKKYSGKLTKRAMKNE